MQQLRQIIPALMIGVLAGGIGTFQSLQSNQANILASSYGNGGNPQFTTQSVAGTRELPPSDGGTEDLKISKTFIPCPGSERYLDLQGKAANLWVVFDNGEMATTRAPSYKNEIIESPFVLDMRHPHVHKILGLNAAVDISLDYPGNVCVYHYADDFSLYKLNQEGCTAINEPTRIGFECK